ncbi:MAG: bifunctional 5,10-methylenetetrahydrofolate dehydrogenase/5,10-methenyltetrahydrofolate cyclohydrolase [Bacillota bacterium]
MILDGKVVADKISKEVKDKLKDIEKDIYLAVIAIGDNSASKSYIKGIIKKAEKLGVKVELITFKKDVKQQKIIKKIEKLNKDIKIKGIMLQMPLPKNLDKEKIINTVSVDKDIDGLTDMNLGKIVKGKKDALIPCTPLAVLKMIKYYEINLVGSNVCIIGRSNIVGKPLANLLTNEHATVTLCHSRTKNLKNITKNADIVVVAVGKKHFLTKGMVNNNSYIFDVGINVENGKLYGDVDFENIKDKVKGITPVPKGVGSVTNTLLIKNTLKNIKG